MKSFCHIWNYCSQIVLKCKFSSKKKLRKFRAKQNFGILDMHSWKSIITSEISTLKFFEIKKNLFRKKQNSNLAQKKNMSEYFWAAILQNYCYMWNHHSRICQIARFRGKIKILKFETKNVLCKSFRKLLETIVILEITILQLVKLKIFVWK